MRGLFEKADRAQDVSFIGVVVAAVFCLVMWVVSNNRVEELECQLQKTAKVLFIVDDIERGPFVIPAGSTRVFFIDSECGDE